MKSSQKPFIFIIDCDFPKVLMSKLRKPPRKMRKLQMKSNPAYFVKRNMGLTRAGMEPVEARDGDKFCNGIYIGQ